MKTYTATITTNNTIVVSDVKREITLTDEEVQTMEALYHNQFNALRGHCISSLWDKGLLWSDCNNAGVKLNFDGHNWLDAYFAECDAA